MFSRGLEKPVRRPRSLEFEVSFLKVIPGVVMQGCIQIYPTEVSTGLDWPPGYQPPLFPGFFFHGFSSSPKWSNQNKRAMEHYDDFDSEQLRAIIAKLGVLEERLGKLQFIQMEP